MIRGVHLCCLQIQCSLRCASPTPFSCSWSCETHVGNNEFNYTKVLVLLVQDGTYMHGEMHCAHTFDTKIKVNTCTNLVLDRLKKN